MPFGGKLKRHHRFYLTSPQDAIRNHLDNITYSMTYRIIWLYCTHWASPVFFSENLDKLHSGVLVKMKVDTKFYHIPATLDHVSEAPKVPR